MIVKLVVISGWLLGWCGTTVLWLEQFDYVEGPHSERGSKMAVSLLLGFLWPALVVVAVVTSPVWGMIFLTRKIATDRYQKQRNSTS